MLALSQAVSSNTGGKVKYYEPYESFKVSFERRNKANGHTLRLEMFEDKKFNLLVENSDGNYIHAYTGKCKKRITKDQAKRFSKDIAIANEDI